MKTNQTAMFATVSKKGVKAFKGKGCGKLNIKKAAKLALNTFTTYLNETNLNKPSDKKKISEVLKDVLY